MPRHFGVLVPSTNTTGEIEYCRLPAELQVHTGRLGKGGNTPFSPSLDADVAYQAKLLGEARVEVIALAQTSASLFADDYDAVTVKRMTEAAFRRIDRPDVDALVVPGGNFPTMDWIAGWERTFGKPVITTNQAALWLVMKTMKVDAPLPGKGRLLEQLPVG